VPFFSTNISLLRLSTLLVTSQSLMLTIAQCEANVHQIQLASISSSTQVPFARHCFYFRYGGVSSRRESSSPSRLVLGTEKKKNPSRREQSAPSAPRQRHCRRVSRVRLRSMTYRVFPRPATIQGGVDCRREEILHSCYYPTNCYTYRYRAIWRGGLCCTYLGRYRDICAIY
jgi:hypothetical protein